ncbi:MAG: hypothetical protein N3F03_04020 [Ignavibacteria bacterium]|nr:hypothetical protein [Ignavibacteria bacterium]
MKNIFFLVFLFFCSEIIAVPRFALMRGNQCKDCHSNPTGGIIRNEDGFRYGKNNLRLMKATQSDVSSFLNDNISIGFDFRFQYLYSQELKKSDFHKMAGGVYTNFTMSDEMNFIATYDLYRGTFEGYGILNVFPLEGYLKVGTFSPNFGVRIDDHTAYTRNGDAGVLSSSPTEGLIFASGYTQTGIEFGFFPTDFSFVTLSAGQDKFPFKTDPSYIGRIELTPSFENFNLLAGSSFGIFRSLQNKFNLTSLFGGFGVGDFTFLSEFVLAKDYVNKDIKSQVLMLETSYRIIRGLDFVARYDRIIPDTKQKNNYSSHLIFGFDFFPYSFVEIKPQFRLNLENPKVDKNNSFVLQFHFWY